MKAMIRQAAMGAGLLLACAAGLRAQSPEGPIAPKPDRPVQQAPRETTAQLRVRVALVSTPVTVREPHGEMVHDLEAKNFRVTDNGIEQKISHFHLGGDPLSLVVLIETSSRVGPMLPELRKTGILLAQTVMGPTGEATLVGFDDSVDRLQEFTSNGELIEKAAAKLKAGTSGSRLFDAMAMGVEMLSSRPQPDGDESGRRRVMLVIAEALDDGSKAKLGEVLRAAQLANVTIYSVGLSTTRAKLQEPPKDTRTKISPAGTYPLPPIPGTVPKSAEEDPRLANNIDLMALGVWAVTNAKNAVKGNPLEIATTATGGAHLAAFKDRSIEKALDEIGGELHSQYSLAYTPTVGGETGYHEIKVTLVQPRGKNLKVRARPGYYVAPLEN